MAQRHCEPRPWTAATLAAEYLLQRWRWRQTNEAGQGVFVGAGVACNLDSPFQISDTHAICEESFVRVKWCFVRPLASASRGASLPTLALPVRSTCGAGATAWRRSRSGSFNVVWISSSSFNVAWISSGSFNVS